MARAAARAARRERDAKRGERTIFGVPERFMRPRLVLLAVVAILVGFGLLMVYSASSVTALNSTGDAAYYLKRQLMFIGVGTVVAIVLAYTDYRVWARTFLMPIWVVTVILLVVVVVAGTDNGMGASRWINLGFFDLQPSEFAKITVIFTAANVAESYFEEGSIDWGTFVRLLAIGVAVPVGLILVQPDKGSTMVIALTLIVMGYLAGMPKRFLLALLILGAVGFLALSLRDDYSRQRLLTMFDPWQDPYGTGWQLIQGFYAFGSGGLLGVGLGFSRQKYSYLPMAHNDFIFAIIGEECGLVGTLGLLVGFGVFMWAGFRIARYAPDLCGRLVAAGCTSLVMIQLLLNVCGVLGMFPLSGKPIPFISYGGSSIIASLMLVGLVFSVSIHSSLPETSHDNVRHSWQIEDVEAGARGLSFVGEPRARSARGQSQPSSGRGGGSFTVVEGGARGKGRAAGRGSGRGSGKGSGSGTGASGRGTGKGAVKGAGKGSGASGTRKRIDLGPSASDRLRGGRGGGPRTRR